jgi:hypothetical protein
MYRLFADLAQNRGGHNFKYNSEVWTSVNREQKSLFKVAINASIFEG